MKPEAQRCPRLPRGALVADEGRKGLLLGLFASWALICDLASSSDWIFSGVIFITSKTV